MTHTAQTLLNAVLNTSATGLVDPSLTLSDVTAEQTGDAIEVSGTATKNGATLNLSINVASIEDLLGLVAAALNATPATKASPKAKAAPKAAPEPEPEPVDVDSDADDAF